MRKASSVELNQKVKVIQCAQEYGVERAAKYHDLDPVVVARWLSRKDILVNKLACRRAKKREFANDYYHRRDEVRQKRKETRLKTGYAMEKQCYAERPFIRLAKGMRQTKKRVAPNDPNPNATARDLWKMALKQRGICALSGLRLTNQNISVDHAIPLCRGGTWELSNLQLVDLRLNYMKRDLMPDEFVHLCGMVAARHKRTKGVGKTNITHLHIARPCHPHPERGMGV